jgi:hypothetical protein
MTKKLDRAEMLAALRCVFEPAEIGSWNKFLFGKRENTEYQLVFIP